MSAALKNRSGSPAVSTETFTSVKAQSSEAQGELLVISAAKLKADNVAAGTVVAQGIYEKSMPNKFYPNNTDYFIRGSENKLFIVRGSTVLNGYMDELKDLTGATIQITYLGQGKNKAGKEFSNWDVGLKA